MIKRIVLGSLFENCYIISENNDAVIIDPGMGLSRKKHELDGFNIKAILLTHGHVDHIDGIGLIDAPIYIYKDEKVFLKEPGLSLHEQFGKEPAFDISKLNIKTIEDGEELQILENPIKVIHTPGHTAGSVCYLYKDNLFTGDTLFNGSCGRTDFPTGNLKDMKESLLKITNMSKDIKVYPGHGDETTIGFEKQYNPCI